MYGPSVLPVTGAGFGFVVMSLNSDLGGVGFEASLVAVGVLLLYVSSSFLRLKLNERRLLNKGKKLN